MSLQIESYVERHDEEPNWTQRFFRYIGYSFLIAFAIGLIQWGFAFVWVGLNEDHPELYGITGDFFGLTNALFSALAFAALIVTLEMQRYELRKQREELAMTREQLELQRKEFELNREVMEGQRIELASQGAAMQRQVFENAVFQLIRTFDNTRNSVRLSFKSGRVVTGSRALVRLDYLLTKPVHGMDAEQLKTFWTGFGYDMAFYFSALESLLAFLSRNRDASAELLESVRRLLSPPELRVFTSWSIHNSKNGELFSLIGIDPKLPLKQIGNESNPPTAP